MDKAGKLEKKIEKIDLYVATTTYWADTLKWGLKERSLDKKYSVVRKEIKQILKFFREEETKNVRELNKLLEELSKLEKSEQKGGTK